MAGGETAQGGTDGVPRSREGLSQSRQRGRRESGLFGSRGCTGDRGVWSAGRVLGTDLTLDAFACHQTKICTRYASRLFDRHALGFDGLALDWRQEVVWINPPWCLLGDIISKLQQEKPAAVLIVPHWPTQVWWPQLLSLGGSHFELPPPKFCVEALHGRLVEPFLHAGLALRAVVLQPGTKL